MISLTTFSFHMHFPPNAYEFISNELRHSKTGLKIFVVVIPKGWHQPIQGDHKIPIEKFKDNSRIFQGSFHDFQECPNLTETPPFNSQDFNDYFLNSRTFQGPLKIAIEIQGFQGHV